MLRDLTPELTLRIEGGGGGALAALALPPLPVSLLPQPQGICSSSVSSPVLPPSHFSPPHTSVQIQTQIPFTELFRKVGT